MTPRRESDTTDNGADPGQAGFLPPADPVDMSLRRIPLYRFGLGVLLLIASVVVGSFLVDVRTKLAELASSPQDNVQWTLAQYEVEFLSFLLSADRAATAGPDTTDAAIRDLRRRYDILYSRGQTLTQSAIYKRAFALRADTARLDDVVNRVEALAPVIDAETAQLRTALPEIIAGMNVLRGDIRTVMTEGNSALALDSDASRRGVSDVLLRLAIASAFLLVVLMTLIFLFRRMANVAERRFHENRATSARLESIFSTSRDAIAVVEADGTIVGLNRAGLILFGATAADLQNARISTILARFEDGETRPLTGRSLFAMASSGRQTGIRLIGLRNDGAQIPVELSVDISTRERRPVCVCVIRDIAHQTAVEAELKQSRDRALAGERAKARFLAVVSHEMRTPLNGIIGTLDLIAEDMSNGTVPDADLRETYLPVLNNSSDALLTLVNDVLDITQIEAGIRLSPRPFDLDAMLQDLVQAETPRARSIGNRISLTTDPPVGVVLGDADRLRQVVANLLGNGVKFTRNGQITLEAARLDGDLVEIQVTDTGFGMSEAELKQVFEDFVRADQAVEQQIQGTGLGLGIARSLTRAMGGDIGAESETGEGSLFWIRLPLPATVLPKTKITPPDRAAPAVRVLLVEDNSTNRFIARRLLENDGHDVTEAENGAEGLALAMAQPFDIILMDISMPVMDGVAAAAALRETDGPNRHTRIVALTAHIAGGTDEGRIENVMDAVLRKPLDRASLRDELRRAAPGDERDRDTPLEGIDPDTRARLIDTFVAQIDQHFLTLTPDAPKLADTLHEMAGACATFGAPDLHDLLIRAETAARDGDTDTIKPLIRQAAARWPSFRQTLRDSMPETREQDGPEHQQHT